MAEIPVEKKSSMSWLWILLALLALALLLWFLLGRDDEEEVIADPAPIEAVEGPALMVGETVDMDSVTITRLSGDMAFYVDYQGTEVPVIFDQVPTPDTPTEGRYDFNVGNIINVTGEVRASTDGLPENADPSFLGTSENYVYATNVEPVS